MIYSEARIESDYLNFSSQMAVALLEGSKSPEALSRVDSLQSDLSDIADHAFQFPQLFTEQRTQEIYDLLEKAGEYLRGSEYEKTALERPAKFRQRVSVSFEAVTAIRRLDRAA